MIEIEKITKRYGRKHVLKSISLNLQPGQSIALIGPNGSGKTTLLKILLGLVKPTDGKVSINGLDISKDCLYRKTIGYMPQLIRFPENMRVSQLFNMIKKMRPDYPDSWYDNELYEAFDIGKMKKESLGSLSGGMRQQVSASLSFLFNPSIIILDEPTAALDPVSNELLKDKIRKSISQNKLILITSHILNDLDEITNHVVYMMEGQALFFKEIVQLQQKTSEMKLNKIIVNLINSQFTDVKS